ncbi:hypothetical protein GIB67_004701 [Kingdonia uniflora]|uniref:Uncharacterized protein n=1 Tax=Kingdonia uniflora TaxID=39325 RepID=A0A7J7P4Y1_9MAGN|nr:hypothetical protein GIB67_004701 [Kingdonia uniflora]
MATLSETTDGPVLNLMTKRLRALKKKLNRITQMEESVSQGKTLNKEQEEVLRFKPSVVTLIDEYEKLRQPLSLAVQEELELAQVSVPTTPPSAKEVTAVGVDLDEAVEDLVKLVYFGCLFDVKPRNDYGNTMLMRIHERGCCLTYDYVTDDATVFLGEKDLDLISVLGGLVTSRPGNSANSHKNALQSCFQHAKLWLANSDQPVESGADITYAGLRERLNKILASEYFTTTPELKAPKEVAAAYQVPVDDPSSMSVEIERSFTDYEPEEEVLALRDDDAWLDGADGHIAATFNGPRSPSESNKDEDDTFGRRRRCGSSQHKGGDGDGSHRKS